MNCGVDIQWRKRPPHRMRTWAAAWICVSAWICACANLIGGHAVAAAVPAPPPILYTHAGSLIADPHDGQVLHTQTLVAQDRKILKVEAGYSSALGAQAIVGAADARKSGRIYRQP